MRLLPGLHLVHKPVGVTSHSIVRELMPRAEGEALCHGGTLDPFAHGLLLILVGEATRLMDALHAIPKTYVAGVRWGLETDTGDGLGQPVREGETGQLTVESLTASLPQFLGWHEQVPPATSAKKIDGEPAYKKAHRGEAVTLPPSRVYLHSAEWRSHDLPTGSELGLTCRGGFYVRSLVRDLGRTLGTGAHVATLHRSAIGAWQDPGVTSNPDEAAPRIAGRALFSWCRTRELTDRELTTLRRGEPIDVGPLLAPTSSWPDGYPEEGRVRVVQAKKFHGLVQRVNDRLVPQVMLKRGL